MNINRIFIANRGEIAARIINTCEILGIESVLGVSEADRDSVPAKIADHVVLLGAAPSSQSYLDIEKIVHAAKQSKCDAIHPGYGFLSENSELALACSRHAIIFIGPTEKQLQAIGDKLLARKNALAADLKVVPGGPVTNLEDAQLQIKNIGLPVLIKAVSGGGGRGMKIVYSKNDLNDATNLAMAEADSAFGDSRIYLERYVGNGRHVEVQILGDGENIIHLGTRDCSIQRRYQKLVEEAPAPNINESICEEMQQAAVQFSQHLQYQGLGTVEFLLDCEKNEFYFLEMNARIQVEHPVTEAITGLDLVAQQIRVAEGRPLGLKQEDVTFNGHAIECRINAEDCDDDFRPSPGTITTATFPAGQNIRIDSHIQAGSIVPPYYDSLLGKLIVHGASREEAVTIMHDALRRINIEGVSTNTALHQTIMRSKEFKASAVNTSFLENLLSHQAAQNTRKKLGEELDKEPRKKLAKELKSGNS